MLNLPSFFSDSSVISKSYLSEPYNNNIEQVLVTRVEKLF